jgi:hypothetical protein
LEVLLRPDEYAEEIGRIMRDVNEEEEEELVEGRERD